MAFSAGHDAMVLHLPSSGRCEYATVKKKKKRSPDICVYSRLIDMRRERT